MAQYTAPNALFPRKNILSYKPWHIQIDEQWQTLEIVNGREQSKTIVAKIAPNALFPLAQ
jgi:hypothetical protein